MNCRYHVVRQHFFDREIGEYQSCGIAVLDKTGRQIAAVPDVSLDREPLEKFVALCNRLELDPCQLSEAVENFLGGH